MKFTVRNLGMISHADIDIKPLTILVGPNNAGKTWLAYLFAGIFGSPGLQWYTTAYSNNKSFLTHPLLDTVANDILNQGNASVDLDEFIKDYSDASFQNVASLASEWLARYLGTYRVGFTDLKLQQSFKSGKELYGGRLLNQRYIEDSPLVQIPIHRGKLAVGLCSPFARKLENIKFIFTPLVVLLENSFHLEQSKNL